VQHRVADTECSVADAWARASAVSGNIGDDDEVLYHVPRLEANRPDEERQDSPTRHDVSRQLTMWNDEQIERCQVRGIEHKMQPLLGALNLEHGSQQPESLVVRRVQQLDLDELDDVLHDMDTLDKHHDHEHGQERRTRSNHLNAPVCGDQNKRGRGRAGVRSSTPQTA
jgi:hypothetical protein